METIYLRAAKCCSRFRAVTRYHHHHHDHLESRLGSHLPARCSSSFASTSAVTQDDLLEQDYHDQRVARQLTARILKSKKRVVKRHQDFVDKIRVQVSAGKGGDGGVAFHSEKFVALGGPSGGNGGQGGNVYIQPVEELSSLSGLTKEMKAGNGLPGQGSWRHGKRGQDLVIEVPYGTVVREIQAEQDMHDDNTDNLLNLSLNAWRRRMRAERTDDPTAARERRRNLFVLFPGLTDDETFLDTKEVQDLEISLLEDERRRQIASLSRPPLQLDFDETPSSLETVPITPSIASADAKILIAQGGQGGFGNPYFATNDLRNPRFATRGLRPEPLRLEFELKTLADVGLVGLPNAGKSTILRSLTFSKTIIASYAFTTLSPQIGTLIIYDDGSYSTINAFAPIQDSNTIGFTDSIRDRSGRPTYNIARQEKLRLTIADCPGLLPNASDNVGLGHDFLRHIERSKLLVYVIDLSSRQPARDLAVLRQELEAYKPGLSGRARLVVANKADKADDVDSMRSKLQGLRDLVQEWNNDDGVERLVLPMSAKLRGNVDTLVASLVTAFAGE